MNNKISVITVVYNDVNHIKATIESFFSQTWPNKEYIIVDGGSTDGTVEIIQQYADRLAWWCSEKDGGIYDAMNKGISHCTGDWINILNSGDFYVCRTSLESALQTKDINNVDVIYGNSMELDNDEKKSVIACDDISQMEFAPIYRHGSSLVRICVHRKFLFDLSKRQEYGFALDWNMIYHVYKAGYRFKKVDTFIEAYNRCGVSNKPYKCIWYNYKITSEGKFSLKKIYFLLKQIIKEMVSQSIIYKYLVYFLVEYVINDILPHIPFWNIRKVILNSMKLKTGYKSFIMKRTYIMAPTRIRVGSYTDINRGCFLDGRGGITIGNNVSISHEVKLITGSHDMNSERFNGLYKPIVIDDYAWLGAGCTILQGVNIGKGAVVCAGAVVTHDVKPYDVVGGVPAKHIKTRSKNLNYHCRWDIPFT